VPQGPPVVIASGAIRFSEALVPIALAGATYGFHYAGLSAEMLATVMLGTVVAGAALSPARPLMAPLTAALVLVAHVSATGWQVPGLPLTLGVVGTALLLASAATRAARPRRAPPAAPPPPPPAALRAPCVPVKAARTKPAPAPVTTAPPPADGTEVAAAVLAAARALTTVDEPAQIADRIVATTHGELRAVGVLLLLWDETGGTFRIGAVEGRDAPRSDELRQVEVDAQALPSLRDPDDGAVLRIDPAGIREPILQSLIKRWRAEHLLAVRLQRGETLLGVLFAACGDRRAVGHRDTEVLVGIAQHATAALARANLIADLQAANQLKEEFMATMSHELRTPLNVILGYTELQLEGAFGDLPEDHLDTVTRIREQALQLLELIQQTLDMSRLERGLMTLDLRDIALPDFIEHLRTQIPPSWRKPTVELNWRVEPGLPPIRTDPPKLQIILRNLIHNGLKFTHQGMVTVSVSAQSAKDTVTFVVQDSGVGIKPEHLAEIFEMFRQFPVSDGSAGGVGLGLYIVKRLATVLGAAIQVSSTPGRGATFRIVVPVAGPLAAIKV
jgi:signal transduction histidine kinase